MPGKGKSVAIEGLLTGVERNDDRTVKHFIVDLEKVTFLGQSATAPRAEESPKKIVNTGTPARLKFTGFFGGQETESKSEGPSSKKRKTADDRAVNLRTKARGRPLALALGEERDMNLFTLH
ncbi:hypothetical protein B0H13DRAFT_2302152 [Mycena leptocephala]|nr:hypothetical protein B0H13DRAFT_2302152 [Mycena leptocephala]